MVRLVSCDGNNGPSSLSCCKGIFCNKNVVFCGFCTPAGAALLFSFDNAFPSITILGGGFEKNEPLRSPFRPFG